MPFSTWCLNSNWFGIIPTYSICWPIQKAHSIKAAICYFQIHSLTARSVPRQFREDLRKGLPDIPDRNIRLPLSSSSHKNQSGHSEAPNSSENECHIIYDSEHQNKVPYPDAEVIRTPSPEHVGIPAGPVKMPPIRTWKSSASGNGNQSAVGYTSDESSTSGEAVKPMRRKLSKQSSNPSVRTLVEIYNCWAFSLYTYLKTHKKDELDFEKKDIQTLLTVSIWYLNVLIP